MASSFRKMVHVPADQVIQTGGAVSGGSGTATDAASNALAVQNQRLKDAKKQVLEPAGLKDPA